MRKALTVVLLLAVSSVAVGQIYSWRDANGKMHYSDQAPSDADAKATNVQAPASEGSGEKSWAEKEQDFRKRQATAAEAADKSAKEQKQAADKQANCERARRSLNALESGTIRFRMGANGERVALEGEEREAELARARDVADSWCK